MTSDEEQGGGSTGVPSLGAMDVGASEPLGRPGLHHWRQSTITEPGLDRRGNIFFAAVEMTRMPMILTDPNQADNPIAFANNAFLDLTGYELEEVVGRNCRFLQGSGTDRETVRLLRETVERKEAISVEILNYRRDGSSFWNAVFIGPVFDPDGRLIYFFASQLDVSRRREAEVSFRQAQKMESIGQLTAGLAHDFNNLLHIITASLERLGTRRDDPKAFERHHAAATAAAERGAKLTGQLLAFARRSRLEPRPLDLTEMVTSMSELLDATAGTKVELHLNLKRRLPRVMVDPVHLEMALLNILINARDASPEGGSVTIRTSDLHLNGDAAAHQLEPGDYVRLAVIDAGSGMPPHVKARATEPFFTTKGPGEGTGLGLAMAHGFVQQTGGRLEIDSEVGRGTEIVMLFPVADMREPDGDEEERPRTLPVHATAAPLILVVDDSREIASIAEDVLQEAGYAVVVAHSGEEGLKRLGEAAGDGGFALVFSDIVMPGGMNGLVFAAEIRARYPDLPVLLTTGYNSDLVVEGPQPHGMDVIGKPYRRTELLGRVQAALRRGVRTGPGRQTSDFGHVEG
jgi:PAS domain S-box-containing protein